MMVSQSQQRVRDNRPLPAVLVMLPNGLWLEEQRLQDAGLRPLTGHDEAYLLSLRASISPARWTSEVLVRCLTHIGSINPVPLEYVQALTIGDREALLLHLRRLTFGERLSCILNCPECSAKLDFALDVDQLLLPPYESVAYWFRVPLDGHNLIATFRLPTGTDQEAIAEQACQNTQAASETLLSRCVHSITHTQDKDTLSLDSLPDETLSLLAELMNERDPQAELLLNNECPECGESYTVLLDMGQFFAEEISQSLSHLYREVHLIAWYYHWSEKEILDMTRPRRQVYLDLLAETLDGASV